MKFIALKTCDGGAKGRISFCCKALKVTRQGFHEYLKNRNKPWKHEELAAKMIEIVHEDECNDTYGRERMHKALLLKHPDSGIPSETTVYRVMTAIGITHRPNRKPNGITKADREARKSDDLLKRDFKADKPFSKCVTDITEVKTKNGKLYVSAIFDCYDLTAVWLSVDDNMRAELCAATVENTAAAYPEFSGAVLHSDRGSQYTSASYRAVLNEYGVTHINFVHSSLKGVAWALWKRYSRSSKKSGSLLSRGEEPLYIHSNSPNHCTDQAIGTAN